MMPEPVACYNNCSEGQESFVEFLRSHPHGQFPLQDVEGLLTAQTMQALRDHRKRQVQERLKYNGLWQDHGLVFTKLVGTPLNRHNVFSRSFKPLLQRAGLPDIPFHALRHSFATVMLAGGEHPKVVQDMMGHSGIRVTMDFYSHVLPDMHQGAADRLGVTLS